MSLLFAASLVPLHLLACWAVHEYNQSKLSRRVVKVEGRYLTSGEWVACRMRFSAVRLDMPLTASTRMELQNVLRATLITLSRLEIEHPPGNRITGFLLLIAVKMPWAGTSC